MDCVICGEEIRDDQERTGDGKSHGYCYSFNLNFQRGKSPAHFRNLKTRRVVVPEVDQKGYITGRFENLSENSVRTKISIHGKKQ